MGEALRQKDMTLAPPQVHAAVGSDAVVVRYSVRVNGITDLVLTKLDVLRWNRRIKLLCCFINPAIKY